LGDADRASQHERLGRRYRPNCSVGDQPEALARRRLPHEGACIFPVLSALEDGFEVFVVADTCGGLTPEGHRFALRRMEAAGARLTSWLQVLLEFRRDWTCHETYEGCTGDRRGERRWIWDGTRIRP
jgi:hypothetical protein